MTEKWLFHTTQIEIERIHDRLADTFEPEQKDGWKRQVNNLLECAISIMDAYANDSPLED